MSRGMLMRRGGGDTMSTLPPPVTALLAEGGDKQLVVSFESVPEEYAEYLSDKAAYIIVVKKGSVPENPKDGEIIIKLDKAGAVI